MDARFGTASSIADYGSGFSLTMSGAGGELILSGSDMYTGGTSVTAGMLEVTTAAALPDGTSLTIGAAARSSSIRAGRRGAICVVRSRGHARAGARDLCPLRVAAIILAVYAWRRRDQTTTKGIPDTRETGLGIEDADRRALVLSGTMDLLS